MEDFVTYEQAVKLKKLGFDWESNGIYKYHSSKIIHKLPKNPHKRKSIKKAIEKYPIITFLKKSTEIEYKDDSWINSYYLDEHKYIDAPSLAQVAKWLRDVKGIALNITAHDNGFYQWEVIYLPKAPEYEGDITPDIKQYATYEAALSEGIDRVLELLTDEPEKK